MVLKGVAAAVFALVLGVGSSVAATANAAEVFLGAATHDVNIHVAKCCYESDPDIQFGLRTKPFAKLLGGQLRAHAIGSINTGGKTDFGAVGLDLRYAIGKRFYIQPGLGGAIHSGPGEKYQASLDRIYFGSRLLFEPELSLGWTMSQHWATELVWTHLSHAQLGGRQNPGMDDLGARVVYRFGE